MNKFILLLQKGVYPYDYMDGWEKFNNMSLRQKKTFYSHLHIQDITDGDYTHTKGISEDFKIKNLGEYYDLNVQEDTLLITDVFKNFQNMCIEIYGLDPAHFLSAPGLAWQAALKRLK